MNETAPTEIAQSAEQPINVSLLGVENEMLVFKDGIDCYFAAQTLNMAGRTSLAEWGNQKGFRSQKQVFNEVVDAEYAIYTDRNKQIIGTPRPDHSKVYKDAFASGIIKSMPLADWADHYTYGVHPFYAGIINEEGFVYSGTDLYQYTPSDYKVMHHAKPSDATELTAAKSSNISREIEVTHRRTDVHPWTFRDKQSDIKTLNQQLDYWYCGGGDGKTTTNSQDNRRMAFWACAESNFVDKNAAAGGGQYDINQHGFVYAEGRCKDFWGSWILQVSHMYVHSGAFYWKDNYSLWQSHVGYNISGTNTSTFTAAYSTIGGVTNSTELSNTSSFAQIDANWQGSGWLYNKRVIRVYGNPNWNSLAPRMTSGGNVNWAYSRDEVEYTTDPSKKLVFGCQ